MNFKRHIVPKGFSIKAVLAQLNELAADAILFVVDDNGQLLGSLTDGDLRRGFIKGLSFETPLLEFIQPTPIFIYENDHSVEDLESFRQKDLKIIPVLNKEHQVVGILNLRVQFSLLPVDAVIMAGGRGERLMPLTVNCPKPLLKIGGKPIIELSIDRLITYGVKKIIISIGYLGDQIKSYFGNGESKEICIQYVEEHKPLGTFGALGLIDNFENENILLLNSDILTNINFWDFYKTYIEAGVDLMVASVPYEVKVPYAILNVKNGDVHSFIEKPTYSYYSNGGIYLFKKSLLKLLQRGEFFNATDFMELLIQKNKRIGHYPILGYWLDIGKHEDFEKAQKDIRHINL